MSLVSNLDSVLSSGRRTQLVRKNSNSLMLLTPDILNFELSAQTKIFASSLKIDCCTYFQYTSQLSHSAYYFSYCISHNEDVHHHFHSISSFLQHTSVCTIIESRNRRTEQELGDSYRHKCGETSTEWSSSSRNSCRNKKSASIYGTNSNHGTFRLGRT